MRRAEDHLDMYWLAAFGRILWTDTFYNLDNLHLTMVERILLICISVRHLDRAPAFAWAPQADPSHKGYNSWGISGVISAYKYNSPSFRNMRMPRDLFSGNDQIFIFIQVDRDLRGPAHAICWWGQRCCQQFMWRPPEAIQGARSQCKTSKLPNSQDPVFHPPGWL